MKILKNIFKIITGVILIPTVLLVAFILIADATGMELKMDGKKSEYSVELPSLFGAEAQSKEVQAE